MRFKFQMVFAFIVLLFNACNFSETQRELSIAEPQQPVLETRLVPQLNCKALLFTSVFLNRDDGKTWLSISVRENPLYASNKIDDCDGDLANLWQDIRRHSDLIRKHGGRIKHMTYITPALNHFPKTQSEINSLLNRHPNIETIEYGAYDVSILEDLLEIRTSHHRVINEVLPEYFSQKHAPIIEEELSVYGLKMGTYQTGEKTSFCILPIDNCINYFPAKQEELNAIADDFRIFFSGTWDWWPIVPINYDTKAN